MIIYIYFLHIYSSERISFGQRIRAILKKPREIQSVMSGRAVEPNKLRESEAIKQKADEVSEKGGIYMEVKSNIAENLIHKTSSYKENTSTEIIKEQTEMLQKQNEMSGTNMTLSTDQYTAESINSSINTGKKDIGTVPTEKNKPFHENQEKITISYDSHSDKQKIVSKNERDKGEQKIEAINQQMIEFFSCFFYQKKKF